MYYYCFAGGAPPMVKINLTLIMLVFIDCGERKLLE